jgi:hypothetical protein
MRRRDFTFTRKPLLPAAVPRRVDGGRGAAPSTASPHHLHRPPPPPLGGKAMAAVPVPASIEEVLAQFQDVLDPKGGLKRTSTEVANHL